MSASDRSWTIAPVLLWFCGCLIAALCVLDGGVDAIADRFREDSCLNAARAIEHAIPPITPIEPRWAQAPIPQPSA